jgi:hypothetical protein
MKANESLFAFIYLHLLGFICSKTRALVVFELARGSPLTAGYISSSKRRASS